MQESKQKRAALAGVSQLILTSMSLSLSLSHSVPSFLKKKINNKKRPEKDSRTVELVIK